MPELTDDQLDMLTAVVKRHETHGASTSVGPRRVEVALGDPDPKRDENGHLVARERSELRDNPMHATARALVRAGMAEWHPKPRPFARVAFARIGKPFSTIARHVNESTRIVPTPKGRDHVAEHEKRSQAARKAARTRKRNEADG